MKAGPILLLFKILFSRYRIRSVPHPLQCDDGWRLALSSHRQCLVENTTSSLMTEVEQHESGRTWTGDRLGTLGVVGIGSNLGSS